MPSETPYQAPDGEEFGTSKGGFGQIIGTPGLTPRANGIASTFSDPTTSPFRVGLGGGNDSVVPAAIMRRLTAGGGRTASPTIGFYNPTSRLGGGGRTGFSLGGGGGAMPAQPVLTGGADSMDPLQRYINSPGDIADFNRFLVALIQGRGTGTYDPLGNPAIMEAIRSELARSQGARERSAVLGAQLDSPNDSALAGYASTLARAGVANATDQAQGQARYQLADQGQQFIQSLLAGLMQSNLGIQRQNNAAINQRYNNDAQRQNPIWDILAQIAGNAAGAGTAAAFAP